MSAQRVTPTQCLAYALNKWLEEGGYLEFRKSIHWCVPHTLHLSADRKVLTHFVPLSDLPQPWHAMFGFEGEIRYEDPDPAPPMSLRGIFLGSLILFVLGTIWVIRRAIK